MRRLQIILGLVLFITPVAAETAISTAQTAKLIRLAEKSVVDSNGWAIDLHDALIQSELEVSRENVCASIAILDQESGFVADPVVPGLGKLSEQALQDKLLKIPVAGRAVLNWLDRTPSKDASFMARIRNARTERDLDLAYRALIDHMGKTTSMSSLLELGLLNKLIEERNEIDTAGSMQVSVKFALEETSKARWLPMTLNDVYAVRDQLYTRHGGMLFGVRQLLAYDTGYGRKIYRFADFNAGRYASRNAAFQQSVATLSGEPLALDGDLLSYGKDGKPLSKVTSTELAIRKVSTKYKLELTDKQIRGDLLREKQLGFTGTRTFISIRDRYATLKREPAAFALIPDIQLNSEKLSRPFTTKRFAESVNKRYQACMGAKI
jgi:Protein of unknown function (DUF1615)